VRALRQGAAPAWRQDGPAPSAGGHGGPGVTLLSVVCTLLVGIILVFVPWTTLWQASHFLIPNPFFRLIVLSVITRGAVTGLGLVNILLAIEEARDFVRRTRRGS
jgi:hypothetical protein